MARPIRKLVVHIGDIKSGTTSIQVALAAGHAPCAPGHLLYPGRMLHHNYLTSALRDHNDGKNPNIQRLRQKIISAGPVDTCVLSAEMFSTIQPKKFRDALNICFADLAEEVQILHYIRPHADRLLSGYAERVKIGLETRSFDAFMKWAIDVGRFFHHDRATRLQKFFGPQYNLRPMLPQTLRDGDVITDFFDAVLGDVPTGWKSEVSVNESLSGLGLSQVALFQAQLDGLPAISRHSLGYEFARLYTRETATRADKKLGLTQLQADFVQQAYQQDAKALDLDFFGGTPLFSDALHTSIEKALKGQPEQTDVTPDPEGMRITAELRKLVKKAKDPETLGKKLREERIRNYIAAAKVTRP